MPLPTGAFSRNRVPKAKPKNGSNTSPDVNGRMVRVSWSRSTAVAAGAPFKIQRRPAARLEPSYVSAMCVHSPTGSASVGLDRDHVRGRRVRERHPKSAVLDREPVAGAAGVLLGEMIEHGDVLVVVADVEPEVELNGSWRS